jgi:hypothetical protein
MPMGCGTFFTFTFMKSHKTVPTWQSKYENVKNISYFRKINEGKFGLRNEKIAPTKLKISHDSQQRRSSDQNRTFQVMDFSDNE